MGWSGYGWTCNPPSERAILTGSIKYGGTKAFVNKVRHANPGPVSSITTDTQADHRRPSIRIRQARDPRKQRVSDPGPNRPVRVHPIPSHPSSSLRQLTDACQRIILHGRGSNSRSSRAVPSIRPHGKGAREDRHTDHGRQRGGVPVLRRSGVCERSEFAGGRGGDGACASVGK